MRPGQNAAILATVVAFLLSGTCQAEGYFKAYKAGPDSLKCSNWLQLRASGQASAEEGWVFGFASGLNFGWDRKSGTEYKLTEADLVREVDSQCRRNNASSYLNDVVPFILHTHIEKAEAESAPSR